MSHQVDPNAIPDGCDAAYIISGPMFVQNMLLAGAMAVLDITDPSYFTITNQGMTAQTTQDYFWGPFIIDDNSLFSVTSTDTAELDKGTIPSSVVLDFSNKGLPLGDATVKVIVSGSQWLITNNKVDQYIVESNNVYKASTIDIPAGQFSLTLDNDKITMNLVNASYFYTADYKVSVTYQESWTLGLKAVNGTNIFWFTQVSPPIMTTTVTQTKGALIREIVEAAFVAALLLITTIGPIVDGLTATADVSELTNEENEVQGELMKLDSENSEVEALLKKDQELQTQTEAKVAQFQATGRLTRIGNAASAAKWKGAAAIFGIAGIIAVVDLSVDKIIAAVANDDSKKELPDFNTFVESCIKPYSWTGTGVSSFDLVSASLANSLVIGLKAKS